MRSNALNAPRILNEAVRFSDSSYRAAAPPIREESHADTRNGVGGRTARKRACAR
jgi:hypothetical protein